MCGFFGLQSYELDTSEKITLSRKAIDLLHSRGPDSNDLALDDNNNLIFCHNRLSILDLSPVWISRDSSLEARNPVSSVTKFEPSPPSARENAPPHGPIRICPLEPRTVCVGGVPGATKDGPIFSDISRGGLISEPVSISLLSTIRVGPCRCAKRAGSALPTDPRVGASSIKESSSSDSNTLFPTTLR